MIQYKKKKRDIFIFILVEGEISSSVLLERMQIFFVVD